MEAPILEGPPAQKGREKWPISTAARFGRECDDAACRSDPTFTRASPGLAVATGNSLKLIDSNSYQLTLILTILIDILRELFCDR